jgi:hypothetical protein
LVVLLFDRNLGERWMWMHQEEDGWGMFAGPREKIFEMRWWRHEKLHRDGRTPQLT